MASFSILLAFVFASVSTYATPSIGSAQRAGTPSSTGIHDGFFYSWWTDNASQATYVNGDKGNFEYVIYPKPSRTALTSMKDDLDLGRKLIRRKGLECRGWEQVSGLS
jgi:hypothetical protein